MLHLRNFNFFMLMITQPHVINLYFCILLVIVAYTRRTWCQETIPNKDATISLGRKVGPMRIFES
jgi:hypothetical protein